MDAAKISPTQSTSATVTVAILENYVSDIIHVTIDLVGLKTAHVIIYQIQSLNVTVQREKLLIIVAMVVGMAAANTDVKMAAIVWLFRK